jgi:hypothetical protein
MEAANDRLTPDKAIGKANLLRYNPVKKVRNAKSSKETGMMIGS